MKLSQNIISIKKGIREIFSLEDLGEFINYIKNDSKKFIEDLVRDDVIIDRPDLIDKVEEENDFANLKVKDFINYHFTKGNNPIKELVGAYKLLTKSIIPTTGFITESFKSISFEHIPEQPIAKINFSEKKNVTIKTKNNTIELDL